MPQGFTPGEYATYHTCAKALCQEICHVSYVCQGLLYARRISHVSYVWGFMPGECATVRTCGMIQSKKKKRRKKKSHVSFDVCRGFMPVRRRRRATYLTTCAQEEKEDESHILRVPKKSCHRHSCWWISHISYVQFEEELSRHRHSYCHAYGILCARKRKSCYKHSDCHAYVCCVLETMDKGVIEPKCHAYVMLCARRKK